MGLAVNLSNAIRTLPPFDNFTCTNFNKSKLARATPFEQSSQQKCSGGNRTLHLLLELVQTSTVCATDAFLYNRCPTKERNCFAGAGEGGGHARQEL